MHAWTLEAVTLGFDIGQIQTSFIQPYEFRKVETLQNYSSASMKSLGTQYFRPSPSFLSPSTSTPDTKSRAIHRKQ